MDVTGQKAQELSHPAQLSTAPGAISRLLQSSLANPGLLLLTLTEGRTGVGSFVLIPIEAQGRHQSVQEADHVLRGAEHRCVLGAYDRKHVLVPAPSPAHSSPTAVPWDPRRESQWRTEAGETAVWQAEVPEGQHAAPVTHPGAHGAYPGGYLPPCRWHSPAETCGILSERCI